MSRNCPVCTVPRHLRSGIDERLQKGEALPSIARDVGLTVNQLANHRREGHSKGLAVIAIGTPDTYHQELEEICFQLKECLEVFIGQGEKGMRDAMLCLEKMAKITEQKAKLADEVKFGKETA
jgi:hypothetical protein